MLTVNADANDEIPRIHCVLKYIIAGCDYRPKPGAGAGSVLGRKKVGAWPQGFLHDV
jgi:hypothetical protein